ncbi:hypothetical protein AAF712_004454 [Marasmius tenuissimus]|uniref:Glycosyltransferase 2-like domain-containing protein n=1 Tax=Marasmius tenuissimus TaxID=585030 RepID=A0ABR3A310_9AGAR
MSEPPNFEQCERHVGTALDKGYLFAAATPLSIFGSLGIVKTAFATLLATTTKPFYGGLWLDDAGFDTKGSVSSLVTLVKHTKQYGAEVQLHRLMKEQHIDDPELVEGIEWFGWRRDQQYGWRKLSEVGAPLLYILSWNASLVLSSMVLSLISITPYLYLIHDHWGHAIGSMLCVILVQLALQIRIHRIATTSLLLMQARKRYPLKIDEAIQDRDMLLELRSRNLREELRDELCRDPDPEKDLDRKHMTELQAMLDAHSLSETPSCSSSRPS